MAAMQSLPSSGEKANLQIARAAGTVMAAFIVSNLVGLLAKTLTARAFGTGFESNSFFAANRFSEILFNLVAGGALGSAFIPVFTSLLAKEERQRAWQLASSITNLVTLVLLLFSLFTMLFSRQVVRYLLAPGFSPEQEILTAQLLRVQVLSSMIFGVSGLIMGILNAHQHFLLPAIAPAMYQIGWILGVYLLVPAMGVFGLAWGVVLGSALHLFVQLPFLLKLPQRRYAPSLGLQLPEVREVARLIAPRLLGVAVVQLNFLLNTYLASFQAEGSITALSLAFPLMLMPEAAIAQSIAIAALPTFSIQVARNKLNEMRSSLSAALRFTLLLAVPASIGLVLLRQPIVALLYEGQNFTSRSTELVAWALLWYGLGMVGHSIVEITSRAFYALHDTKTPVIVGVGTMSLNLLFSFLFVGLFRRIGWMPHGGLALANTTATLLECVLLLELMRRRLGGLEGRRLMIAAVRFLIAALIMAGMLWLLKAWLLPSPSFIGLGFLILICVVTYLLGITLLRSDELRNLINLLRRKAQ